jgi:hypothetical protein
MDHIEFVHQCHVDGMLYVSGSVVAAAALPQEWLKGALLHQFVKRVNAPQAKPVEPVQE